MGYSKNRLYQGYLREIFSEFKNSRNKQQMLHKMALIVNDMSNQQNKHLW